MTCFTVNDLTDNDIGVGELDTDGKIYLVFKQQIKEFGMTLDQARKLGLDLLARVDRLEALR